MTAPAIQKYLSRRLELERHGGTIFARDEHTLILADSGKFTSSHAALLQTVFPHVTFSVVPCDSSASGFIVIGWRMHGSVEDTKLSTNKQLSLSLLLQPNRRASVAALRSASRLAHCVSAFVRLLSVALKRTILVQVAACCFRTIMYK